jgi:large subunit ribosomal protein L5
MSEDKKEKSKHPKGAPPPSAKGAGKKEKKPKAVAAAAESQAADEGPQAPPPPPRLLMHYREKVVPELQQKFGYKNTLAVPRLDKVVISMGIGKIVTGGEKGKVEQAEKELGVIAGQKPVRCKAKKSVANFKVREGQETGLKVTLRGARMYEFVDRLVTLAIPRVRDFRGLSPTAFDKEGNYNFGFVEQTVFPEVNAAEVTFQQGMNITMVTTAPDPDQGRELLRQFGFPFRTDEKTDKN